LDSRCHIVHFVRTNVYNNPNMAKSFQPYWSRRRVLGLLGMSAAAANVSRNVFGQAPAFPKGAIIRTLLKDYAPEELANGATLFHEHMQLAADFNARFSAATAAARAANGLPPASRPWRSGPGRSGGSRHYA
jgi:hypothetical protein